MQSATARQNETPLPAKPSRLIATVAWILTIFLTLTFVSAGGVKFSNNPVMAQEFAKVGLGQWFRYFTGSCEVIGAIGVLIPRVRFWAALLLATVMVGATIANLTVLQAPPAGVLTVVLLILALGLAWLRRPQQA